MKICKTVCSECPFRRKACAGYLGANDPVNFVINALSDTSVACHKSMNQELPHDEWQATEAASPRCRGAIILMRNQCILPRDQEMADLVKTVDPDREKIFSNHHEFINHHESAKTKSWE